MEIYLLTEGITNEQGGLTSIVREQVKQSTNKIITELKKEGKQSISLWTIPSVDNYATTRIVKKELDKAKIDFKEPDITSLTLPMTLMRDHVMNSDIYKITEDWYKSMNKFLYIDFYKNSMNCLAGLTSKYDIDLESIKNISCATHIVIANKFAVPAFITAFINQPHHFISQQLGLSKQGDVNVIKQGFYQGLLK